jgi:hypothetical protein
VEFRLRSGLLLCRVGFDGEPEPFFGDRKPGIDIFRPPSLSGPIQAFRSIPAISV